MKCFCREEATRCWINPSNPNDKGYYCEKHYHSINGSFNNFLDLKMLVETNNLHVLDKKEEEL